jgi:hypothetical protein
MDKSDRKLVPVISRRKALSALMAGTAIAAVAAGGALWASAAQAQEATLYKNPQCGCCEAYAAYLRRNGYDVKVIPTHDLSLINRDHGVPSDLEGCHTMLIGNYVVEGHVPAATLNRLLKEKPNIKGISLPGMPEGSPGMSGSKAGPFTIYAITDGKERQVYAVE